MYRMCHFLILRLKFPAAARVSLVTLWINGNFMCVHVGGAVYGIREQSSCLFVMALVAIILQLNDLCLSAMAKNCVTDMSLCLFVCLSAVCLSSCMSACCFIHNDVITWKHLSRYWPFVWGIHRSPAYFAGYGFKILCKISKSTFEISHKILNPYTAKYAFYCHVLLVSVTVSLNCDVISLSETCPCCSFTLSYFHLLFVFPHNHTATHLSSLLWCNNGRDGISNHQPHDCLLNHSFRRGSKKTSKYIKATRQWPLCGEFTGDRWIPRTNGQWRGNFFHLMTSSSAIPVYMCYVSFHEMHLYRR